MRIDIRIEGDALTRFQNQIAALGEGRARVGIARAINHTTRIARTRVIRAITRQTSIPRKIVQRAVQMSLAAHQGTGPLQGVLYSTGRPLSLKHFRAAQFAYGVRVKVWNETRRLESHFINAGRWNSGNPVANGHVFRRVGSARLPIERIDGPSVPEGMIAGESAHAFTTLAQQALPARVSHELGRLLGL